jgi:hypothetical protein
MSFTSPAFCKVVMLDTQDEHATLTLYMKAIASMFATEHLKIDKIKTGEDMDVFLESELPRPCVKATLQEKTKLADILSLMQEVAAVLPGAILIDISMNDNTLVLSIESH